MKPLNKLSFIMTIVFSFLVSGCYTVLWTPDEQLPNENTYVPESGYYNDDYYYYYDYPWWLNVRQPVTDLNNNNNYERNKNISTIRNTGEGRGTPDRRDVLTPPPATINDNTNNNSNNTSTNQNTEIRKPTNSSNTNSNNNATRSSSSNNSNIRNSNGGRNNGGGRK